jgi:hypothetical protein
MVAAVAAALLLAACPLGCDQIQQQLTGAKDQGPALVSLRETLGAKRSRLSVAVMNGQMDFVPGYLTDLKSTLDSLETQAGKMSIMDGQEMKIKVAAARTAVTAAQPFVMQNDVEGVKAQQRNLDQVLFEIDEVLGRAIGMVDVAPTGGGS